METKICSKCKIEKTISEFRKRKDSKDGLRTECKVCNKFYEKEYLLLNREKIKERKKRQYSKNKENILEKNKKYREENIEKIREYDRKRSKNRILKNKTKPKVVSIKIKMSPEEKKERNKKYKQEYFKKNKEKYLELKRERRKENPEKYKESNKKYYEKSKDIQKIKKRIWIENNREKYNSYWTNRKKNDVFFDLCTRVRGRLNSFLKIKNITKKNRTFEIVGCAPQFLKEHLEKQFKEGMSWENRNLWHIDHITPLSSAQTEDELYKLCHYSNLQPLWAEDNLKKSNKIVEPFEN
jgi:hypothetical protein